MDIHQINYKISSIQLRILSIKERFLPQNQFFEQTQSVAEDFAKDKKENPERVERNYNTRSNSNLESLVEKISKEEGVSSNLVKAIIATESNFNPSAISSKGAIGLMQLMPQTAKMLQVDPNKIEENIRGGIQYLKLMANKYKNLDLALAAYNAGPGNVDKYGGIPPFLETKNYIKKIKKILQTLEN
ncbi:MAG: lytic transglycosylase domain-containing protein [Leptonema sp. (in: bacteria)]